MMMVVVMMMMMMMMMPMNAVRMRQQVQYSKADT